MKRLETLRILIALLFFVSMLGVVFGLPMIIMVALMPDRVPFEIGGNLVSHAHLVESVLLFIVLYVGYCSFTYGVYLLKKLLANFSKRVIFDTSNITLLDQIGKSFIVTAMLWAVPPFFYKIYAESRLEIGINFDGFGSPMFIASLGLFFMVLSEVFLMAKGMKEDADLTI